MTTFNTGNAVPSADARDRFDNSQTFDEVINGTFTYYVNRVGANVMSVKGMETLFNADQIRRESEFDTVQSERANEYAGDKLERDTEFAEDQAERIAEFNADQDNREFQFNTFMDASGYEPPIPYAPGLLLDRSTKTVSYLGNEYRAKGSFIPMTTSNWVADEAKLKLIGDDSLRQTLADPAQGSREVAYSAEQSVNQALGQALSGIQGAFVDLSNYGGVYDYNETTRTGTDNTAAMQSALNSGKGVVVSGSALIKGATTAPAGSRLMSTSKGKAWLGDTMTHMGDDQALYFWRAERWPDAPSTTFSGHIWSTALAGQDLRGWVTLFCEFKGFFYSTNLIGEDGGRRCYDLFEFGNKGTAPAGRNAGVFQHKFISNFVTAFCQAFGGQNASGHNYVGDCRDGLILECVEDGVNSYAGLELENSPNANVRIIGGRYPASIWLDDCKGVDVVAVNTPNLRITAETLGSSAININGGNIGRVRMTPFGVSPTQIVDGVKISDVNFDGSGGWASAIDALTSIGRVEVLNCTESGTYTNCMLISRSASLALEARGNNFKTQPVISSSGGSITAYDNNVALFGSHNAAPALERIHRRLGSTAGTGGGFSGGAGATSVPASGSAAVSVSMPSVPVNSARAGTLLISCRNSGTGALFSFSVNIIVASSGVSFSGKFGETAVAPITVSSMSWTGSVLTVNLANSVASPVTVTVAANYTLAGSE